MLSSGCLVSTLSRERETINPGCSPRLTIAMDSKRVGVRGRRSGPTDPKVRPEIASVASVSGLDTAKTPKKSAD